MAGGLVPLGTGPMVAADPYPVVGLRHVGVWPSQGRIPHGPAPHGAADLRRSARWPVASDVALALDVVVGPDPNDLSLASAPWGAFRSAATNVPQRVLWCPSIEGSELDAEVLAVSPRPIDSSAGVEVEVEPIVPRCSGLLLLFYGGMAPGTETSSTVQLAGHTRLQEILTMADGLLSPESIEVANSAALIDCLGRGDGGLRQPV